MINMYVGDNELRLYFECGYWCVKEAYEKWAVVFSGSYDQCVVYCNERWVSDMEESLF